MTPDNAQTSDLHRLHTTFEPNQDFGKRVDIGSLDENIRTVLAKAGMISDMPVCYMTADGDGISIITQFLPIDVGKIGVRQFRWDHLQGALAYCSSTLTVDQLPENVFDDMEEGLSHWLRQGLEMTSLLARRSS